MLLRNRSRAVTKPTLMADHSSQQTPNQTYAKAIRSLFVSPKFREFTAKCLSVTDSLRSPTSILDSGVFSPLGNPFLYDRNEIISPKITSKKKNSWEKTDSKGVGLALVHALKDERIEENSAKPSNGNVLFGTQLRVKIPPLLPSSFSQFESQTCAADFGIKTMDSIISPTGSQNSGIHTKDSPRLVVSSALSLSEMELSEEYTCVITHGPSPRTTHIFDNCIVESYCSLPDNSNSTLKNFLSFCYTCKKHLEQTKDIFIYRGEKAFCSHECRYREMVLDGAENSEFDNNIHS